MSETTMWTILLGMFLLMIGGIIGFSMWQQDKCFDARGSWIGSSCVFMAPTASN